MARNTEREDQETQHKDQAVKLSAVLPGRETAAVALDLLEVATRYAGIIKQMQSPTQLRVPFVHRLQCLQTEGLVWSSSSCKCLSCEFWQVAKTYPHPYPGS